MKSFPHTQSMAIKTLTAHFTTNGYPQTGLTPTITIHQITSTTYATVVDHESVIELGSGWYFYRFTTYDPRGSYVFMFDGGVSMSAYERFKVGGNEGYVEDISSEVWNENAIAHAAPDTTGLMLNQIKADTASVMVSDVAMSAMLTTLLKFERNRTKIDMANAQLIIFDDDCVTPIATFDLKDFNGMPSVTEVCERIPTTCGN